MKTDNRQKILLILTGIVLAFFVGDKLIYTPLTDLWKAREKELVDLRLQIKEGNDLIDREDQLRAKWRTMRTNALPRSESLAQEQLLKSLEDWAQESNVSLNGTAPQWKSEDDNHRTLVCRVDASGSLWQLSRFIYHIEKGPMGLKLDSVDITSRDNTGQLLALGLQVNALVLMPQNQTR